MLNMPPYVWANCNLSQTRGLFDCKHFLGSTGAWLRLATFSRIPNSQFLHVWWAMKCLEYSIILFKIENFGKCLMIRKAFGSLSPAATAEWWQHCKRRVSIDNSRIFGFGRVHQNLKRVTISPTWSIQIHLSGSLSSLWALNFFDRYLRHESICAFSKLIIRPI